MPQISVIVPVYKVEPYLCRCVDSILGQSFEDFELILVDDGSPDRCGAICDEYAAKDSRVHVIHQENGGLSAARNAGIDWAFAHSDSQWLSFVDSDDWVHPQYLQLLLTGALEHGVSASKCTYYPVTSEADVPAVLDSTFEQMLMQDAYLLKNSGVCAVAKLYTKDSFAEIRFPLGKLHEDLFTTHRVLFQYETIAVSSAPLYYYRSNPQSITKRDWSPKRLDELDAFEEQLNYFAKKNYTGILQKLTDYYLAAIGQQYYAAQSAKHPENKIWLKHLRKRMRSVMIHHFSYAKKSWQEQKWCYNIAFPRAMSLYWRVKALRDKKNRSEREHHE